MTETLREKIVDAAERLLLRKGLRATMDEMAAEAGITKGGLFYYFSGKDELVLSVIDRYEHHLSQERDSILRGLPPARFSFFRATVLAMLDQFRKTRNAMPQIGGLFDVPKYRDAIAAIKMRIFADICQHYPYPDKVTATIIFIDGMWWNNVFAAPIYYEGYWADMKKGLLRYLDAMEMDVRDINPSA